MLSEGVTKSDNISFINENNREYYVEVLPINSIRGNVSEYISDLIDNDIDADEIKSTFKTDGDIKKALTSYLKDHEELDDEDDKDLHDDDDEHEDY